MPGNSRTGASPTAAIIDRQSARPLKKGASLDPPGYEAGSKIKGKKRHVLVETEGLLLCAFVHSAGIQDRGGGVLLMSTRFGLFLFLLKLNADGGYQGLKFQPGLADVCRQISVNIVNRCDVGTLIVLPRRWIVERTIAWLNRCRRLAKDRECLNRNALAVLRRAATRLTVRSICQSRI